MAEDLKRINPKVKLRKTPTLIAVTFAEVKVKQNTGKLLEFLRAKFVMRFLGHYKRIKKVDDTILVLLYLEGVLLEKADKEFLDEMGIQKSDIGVINLPTHPFNYEEQELWSKKYWPMNLRVRNKAREKKQMKIFTNKREAEFAENCMRKSIKMAKNSKNCGKIGIGAVIADVENREVICLSSDGRTSDQNVKDPNMLEHATMKVIKERAVGLQKAKSTLGKGLKNTQEGKNYICTALDLFITAEPCLMCGMAIVHSRFKRIFFGTEIDKELGACVDPGGRFKANAFSDDASSLHCDNRLNHHLEVYGGFFAKECKKTLELEF